MIRFPLRLIWGYALRLFVNSYSGIFKVMKLPRNFIQNQISLLISGKAFSLVELLVVVTIMTTLLSIGVAYYTGFSQNATLDGAAKQLRANLRLAQAFALNGEKIGATCTGTFNGYYVTFQKSSTPHSYTLGQYCSTSGNTNRTPPSPINLPSGIVIGSMSTDPVTILFQSVRGVLFYPSASCCSGVSSTSTLTINVCISGAVCSGNNLRQLTVTSDGKVQ